ncbi:MAG: DUF3822 family protein [Bacteroidetes bacterium]|nr:DUF3822 family protein [Bacteroidota bacterium]
MSDVKTKISPAINLIDESFDPKKSNTYHLSILSNEKSLTFAVLDTDTNKYLVLQSFSPTLKGEDILAPFKAGSIYTSFKSVTCAVAHNNFTLVPFALFDEENKRSFLEFNHPVDNEEKIHSDTLNNLEAKNIFTISRSFEAELRKHFITVHFLHNSTSFIEGLLIRNKNKKGKKVFSDFHSSYFEIVILEDGKLLFSNSFKYKAPEDIAYYILFVYEQLHLNPEEIELVLSGEIEKTEKEHALLYNYIRHVKFASPPEGFKYSYNFDEIPNHKFFSLFTQYLITN